MKNITCFILFQDFSVFNLDVSDKLIQFPFSPPLVASKLQFWIIDHVDPDMPIRFQFDFIGCQTKPEANGMSIYRLSSRNLLNKINKIEPA